MIKHAWVAAAIALSATAAHADVTLLSEGFDNIAVLPGWILNNASSPVGITGWYQGDVSIFGAQSGADDSYIAANYNSAVAGGTIDNRLTSPSFATAAQGTVSFYARAQVIPAFADTLSYSLMSGNQSLYSNVITLTGTWTKYSFDFAGQGPGSTASLAFRYSGSADTSNYVGIDTVEVTAVPEPATWWMLGLGLAGVGVVARRRGA